MVRGLDGAAREAQGSCGVQRGQREERTGWRWARDLERRKCVLASFPPPQPPLTPNPALREGDLCLKTHSSLITVSAASEHNLP